MKLFTHFLSQGTDLPTTHWGYFTRWPRAHSSGMSTRVAPEHDSSRLKESHHTDCSTLAHRPEYAHRLTAPVRAHLGMSTRWPQAECLGMSISVARTAMAPDCTHVWVYPSPSVAPSARPDGWPPSPAVKPQHILSATRALRLKSCFSSLIRTDPAADRPVEHMHHPTEAGVTKPPALNSGTPRDQKLACGVRHTLDGTAARHKTLKDTLRPETPAPGIASVPALCPGEEWCLHHSPSVVAGGSTDDAR